MFPTVKWSSPSPRCCGYSFCRYLFFPTVVEGENEDKDAHPCGCVQEFHKGANRRETERMDRFGGVLSA